MDDLIVRNAEGNYEALPAIMENIRDFELGIKKLKEAEDELKTKLLEEMEAKGLLSLKNDFLTITYVAPTTRESLDTKTLREELPDIYNSYCKITPVKSNVRIKVK